MSDNILICFQKIAGGLMSLAHYMHNCIFISTCTLYWYWEIEVYWKVWQMERLQINETLLYFVYN